MDAIASSSAAAEEPKPHSNFLVREIHKNTWLKRIPFSDKKGGPFSKKPERWWVVFCIHDDTEAFLEFYVDPKAAAMHRPVHHTSLNSCQHISPSIFVHGDKFEFAVTLEDDVVRLVASSWEQMQEWVESIRAKLQEMRLLTPQHNVYSKLPEVKPPLAPTRDPTSPLPPPPRGYLPAVPGTEIVARIGIVLDQSPPSSAPPVVRPHPSVSGLGRASSSESAFSFDFVAEAVSQIGSSSSQREEVKTPTSSPVLQRRVSRNNSCPVTQPNDGIYEHLFLSRTCESPGVATNAEYSNVGRRNGIPLFRPGRSRQHLSPAQQPRSSSLGRISDRRERSRSREDARRRGSRERYDRICVALPHHNVNGRSNSMQLTETSTPPLVHPGTPCISLKEQQVLRLRREMEHTSGVRMQLRRKDCCGSIALVDYQGRIFIAGWKQREHPVLYNALHVGDTLVSTCGVIPHNAAEAQKTLRTIPQGAFVDLVVRRLPFGQVFAMRRCVDGQGIGVITEGSTSEIKEVIAGGLSSQCGLSPRATTCDGQNLCTWSLTEINGRPLSLFPKDHEVRDRLNAVGRDISILVQPSDLVKHLRRQLKTMRSYKDYVL